MIKRVLCLGWLALAVIVSAQVSLPPGPSDPYAYNAEKKSISLNNIKSFPKEVLNKDLKILKIRAHESFREIPADIKNFKNLEDFELISSGGNIIFPESFADLQNIKRINISLRGSEFPQPVLKLKNLQELKYGDKKLRNWPENLGSLENLKILDLSYFRSIDTDFANLPELVLPKSIGNLKKLERFIAVSNQMKKLPDEVGGLTSLQDLDLGYNSLTDLPEHFGLLKNLKKLNLQQNQFTELPKAISGLENLQDLNLNFCLIEKIPSVIGNLKSLKTLGLAGNKISSDFKKLYSIPNLEELNVYECGISKIPSGTGNMKQLKSLNIGANPLSSESVKELYALSGLEVLEMGNCKLEGLPSGIRQLKNLKRLGLDKNKISQDNLKEIYDLENLESLDLSECQIDSIPKSIEKLKNLKSLYLWGNKISQTDIEGLKKALPYTDIRI